MLLVAVFLTGPLVQPSSAALIAGNVTLPG